MEWFTVHEKCWGNPPTRAFTRIIRNWKIKICILEGKYFFLVPGKQHLLLHFDNRIGRSLCRKICYKLGLHICMREEAPRRQRQHLLCLDRDLGLRVEKSNSFSGLINIKMQFLIEPAIPSSSLLSSWSECSSITYGLWFLLWRPERQSQRPHTSSHRISTFVYS